MSKLGLAAVWVLVAGCWVAPVRAQPSIWEMAADPRVLDTYRALLEAESHLIQAAERPRASLGRRRHLRAAAAVLKAHADGPDPRVAVLLAQLLTDLSDRSAAEVRQLLEPVLQHAPATEWAGEGWQNLGQAAALLGEIELEAAAYRRALELLWDPRDRANLHYNLADALMTAGRLSQAVREYRRALSIAADPHTQVLALYGLGITLERSGDLPAALNAMRRAASLRHPDQFGSALDEPTVFFVPAYDLYYYKALERMALAEAQTNAAARRAELAAAVAFWNQYLQAATPDQHRWVENARLHRDHCRRERGPQPRAPQGAQR